jgi:hypothetical protein
MHLTDILIWFLLCLISLIAIYVYRVLHKRALKALANTARIQSNPKSLKKLNQQIKKSPPSFMSTLFIVFFSMTLIFSLYKYFEWNRLDTISKFQSIATTAMQNECTANCSVYGITQNQLIGPQLEQDCCYGRYHHPDYIFMWQSNNPKVILKEHLDTSGTNAVWVGARVKQDIESTILVRNDMGSVIQQNQNIIDVAYQHALTITPSMHASFVVIHLIIAPNGQVTNSNIISTDINSIEFKNSLLKIFNNLHFSSGNFQIMNYTYQLQLK